MKINETMKSVRLSGTDGDDLFVSIKTGDVITSKYDPETDDTKDTITGRYKELEVSVRHVDEHPQRVFTKALLPGISSEMSDLVELFFEAGLIRKCTLDMITGKEGR